jgi:CHAT domain-containing protein/tetratricopeptide (TPR) repeat protein
VKLCAVGLVILLAQGLEGQSASPLVAGANIDRTLKAGEVHGYTVSLAEGDYFAIVIEQEGIDARPAILDPDGQVAYEYDFGEWGEEPAAIVADRSGVYRLEVRTEPSSSAAGRYRLRVNALRPASDDDRRRADVLRLQVEAFPLVRSGKPDFVKAREQYERILAIWTSLDEGLGVAHALTALGYIASRMDDAPATLEYARREVEAYRAIGHEYGEARALRSLGIDLNRAGEPDAALEALEQSLALHRDARRVSSQITVLADLAGNRGGTGDFARALEHAYAAIDLARTSRNGLLEARGWSAAGLAHQSLGELELAVDAYRRAASLATADEVLQANTKTRLGSSLLGLGRDDEAELQLREGLAGWTRLGFRAQQGQALVALGDLHARAGRIERARQSYEDALSRSQEALYPLGEAIARQRLADTAIGSGDAARALELLEGVPNDRLGDVNVRARIVATRARAALVAGDTERARRLALDAVQLTESAQGRAQSTRIDAGLLASAQPVYETAVRVLMAMHDVEPGAGHDVQAFAVSEHARARSLLDMVSSGFEPPADRRAGDVWNEFRAVQRQVNAKAGTLAATRSGSGRRDALTRDVDALTARLAVLEARLRSEVPAIGGLVVPEPVTVERVQRELLDGSTTLLEVMLGEPNSHAWVVSGDRMTSYRLAARQVIESAAARARAVAEPPSGRDGVSGLRAGDDLSRLLSEPLRAIGAGQRVVMVVPGALQDVPFAALPSAPKSTEPLGARHELVHAPSAAVVLAMGRVPAVRRTPQRALAVIADPVFDAMDPRVSASAPPAPSGANGATVAPGGLTRALGSLEENASPARLPFSRQEADRVAALLPPAQVWKATDFAAHLEAVTSGTLSNFRIVHFATHGVLNTRTPELSGLVFSLVDVQGRPREGFLRLHDVPRLRLSAELVVLSGCDTARGRRLEGEGTIGLTRGFISAGARQVVASLWRVDDLATAQLMEEFYTNLLRRRMSAPAALRAAQQQLAASPRWGHPYFWAGFAVQGDWR